MCGAGRWVWQLGRGQLSVRLKALFKALVGTDGVHLARQEAALRLGVISCFYVMEWGQKHSLPPVSSGVGGCFMVLPFH